MIEVPAIVSLLLMYPFLLLLVPVAVFILLYFFAS